MEIKMIISDKAALALKAAVTTRGRHKGLLLAKAPKSDTLAYAAWQAAQFCCNPFKVSIVGIMFLNDEQREVYEEVLAIFDGLGIKSLDRDRNSLERLGVW
jgi:hypothetical protein